MTVSGFTAETDGQTVTCRWVSDESYSWLYGDAEVIAELAEGITEVTTAYIPDMIYQAVDSSTSTPIPDPLEPVPQTSIRIRWNESSETDLAEYQILLDGVSVKYQQSGSADYTYRTPRLDAGEHSLTVIALDATGNKIGDPSELTYVIESAPDPVQSSVLTQSAANLITLTLVAPVDWPT